MRMIPTQSEVTAVDTPETIWAAIRANALYDVSCDELNPDFKKGMDEAREHMLAYRDAQQATAVV